MMLSFYFKKIGYWIVILAFVMFFLVMLNYRFLSPSTETWVDGLKWFSLSGLVLVTVSKEKNETAEIERLRYLCFFRKFFGALLSTVVFSLSNLLVTHDPVTVDKALALLNDYDFFKFSAVFLSVHVFVFRRELRKSSRIS